MTECSHPAWIHIGMERYCASCGIDRDDLTADDDQSEEAPS